MHVWGRFRRCAMTAGVAGVHSQQMQLYNSNLAMVFVNTRATALRCASGPVHTSSILLQSCL